MTPYHRTVFFLLVLLVGLVSLPAQTSDTLRVGIIPFKTEEMVMATYLPLFEYVAQQVDKVARVSLVDEKDLGYLLANDTYDIGIFTPFPYLRAKVDFEELEIFASHIIDGAAYYQGAFVTRSSSGIKTLEDLAKKRLIFVKPTSTSGYLFPKGMLEQYNLYETRDYYYWFSGSHDSSLLALQHGKADAIAIDVNALSDHIASLDTMEIIMQYEIPYHAYVFSPNINPALRSQILSTMLEAHKAPRVRPYFSNMLEIARWVKQDDEYYNPLRKYLKFARVKPAIKLRIDTKSSARASFAATGDLLDVVYDNIVNELRETDRFLVSTAPNQNNFYELRLDISMVNNSYQCQIYLNEKRLEYYTDVKLEQLQEEIPKAITQATLNQFEISAHLFEADSVWYITYGRDDGINTDTYQYALKLSNEEETVLQTKDLLGMDETKTYFAPKDAFSQDVSIIVSYSGEDFKSNLQSYMPEDKKKWTENFWENKDNQWGIIGLVVTLIGVVVGGFLTRRKQKRFRILLYESNQLLLEYIKGRYKLDNEIIAHKEKLNLFLERGFITENQYLILKHRVEDIHILINEILKASEDLDDDIKSEVQEIIKDGVMTEKEYARLMALIQQRNPS